MAHAILAVISGFIISTISSLGYLGIILLMAIESANIPLPSEVIMPFSGFLVASGRFNLWLIALAGGVGCLAGSLLSYWIGKVGGRPLIEKYGKYILVSHHDLDIADRFFKKRGEITIFISRLLPVVRTFISFPAGIAEMNLWRFSIYTFVGSVVWSLALGYVGVLLGANWENIRTYFRGLDVIILIVLMILLILWIVRHLRHRRTSLSR